MRILDWLAIAFGLLMLWFLLVALFFGFASTINATETKEGLERTGKMACLWAFALTAIYAVGRWLL